MHMADALISPIVGGTMWAATAGIAAYSIKKVQTDLEESKVPLMGVMGAFVFASQMINFTIPATGSSGHIGGGLLLAVLLGPYAGFLTMASILTIQALFFADGGLLALGCNIFNLGFYTCFIAYPLIYKKFISKETSSSKIFIITMITAIIGLQLGAFSVVFETLFSGITELPFSKFALLMQPIHLAIGIVEGLVTAAVISYVWKARPEIADKTITNKPLGRIQMKPVLITLMVLTIFIGGILSWFSSSYPDGLEWSMMNASGQEELAAKDNLHQKLAIVQEKIAFLPDYGFKKTVHETIEESTTEDGIWPQINVGTSVSGLIGGSLTLLLAGTTGFILYWIKKVHKAKTI
jgi:cobalt/nickel transport system permease protein